MSTKHKHYNEIVAWAEGKEIEVFDTVANSWVYTLNPKWVYPALYRVKPIDYYEEATFEKAELDTSGLIKYRQQALRQDTWDLKITYKNGKIHQVILPT